MKNILKPIILLLLISIFGCKDDDKLIFESITDDIKTAGGLRTINLLSPSVNLLDLDNSKFSVEIEEWDAQNGKLLESVDVFVQFQDNTPDNGDSSVSEVNVVNLTAADFIINNESGLPRTIIDVTALEVVSLLRLNANTDIDGGDVFRFRLQLNLSDGSVFSSGNLEGNITGPFFNSPFSYPIPVVRSGN